MWGWENLANNLTTKIPEASFAHTASIWRLHVPSKGLFSEACIKCNVFKGRFQLFLVLKLFQHFAMKMCQIPFTENTGMTLE